MKKSLIAVTIVILVFSLGACAELLDMLMGGVEEPVSIQQRLTSFVEKLNSDDRSTVYQDLHPDSESYDQQTAAYWDDLFPLTEQDYSITYAAPVEGTVTGTQVMTTVIGYFVADVATEDTLVITFKQSGEDWYILSITREGTELFRKIGL